MSRLSILLVGLLATACANAPAFEGESYGEPLTLTEFTPISAILAAPADYLGTRVLVEGTVTDVCNNQGCWIEVEAEGGEIQVKVDDGVIVFPTSAKGKAAVVEGTVEERRLTAEQAFAAAAHRAEEQNLPFDSTRVFGDTTIYRIRGLGAVIREQ